MTTTKHNPMRTKTTAAVPAGRYGYPAMFFHWGLALLIPVLIGLGWYMLGIEDQPGSDWYFALHISLGLTAALLIALRFAWRLGHPPHPFPGTMPAWQAKAARISHALLYVLMLLMPLTGYLGASFSGEAVGYFGLPLPAWAAKNLALKEQFFGAHAIIAWVLVAMIGVHALGAFKHLLIDKNAVFQRMWPRWQRGRAASTYEPSHDTHDPS